MSTQPSTQSPEASSPESPRRAPHAPSGRLLLRMPSELHGELARAAEREGTSLNQFITRTLAHAVAGGRTGEPSSRRRGGRDLTVAVLVANAVAVGAAAIAATAILLVAWLG